MRCSLIVSSATSACLIRRFGLLLEHLAHPDAVKALVHLGARRPDCRASAGVQETKLNADRVCHFAHGPT